MRRRTALHVLGWATVAATVPHEALATAPDHAARGVPGRIPLSDDPRIAAWQRLNFGLFVHWGLYSQLGGVWNGEPVTEGYSEQIQMWAEIPDADYAAVADGFTAEKFDPDAICALAKAAGMRYVVITSKHHDGFAMFRTATTDYNIVGRSPYARDPLLALAQACRRHGLRFGIYFSLVDWHAGHAFDHDNENPLSPGMERLIEAQLRELLTHYGPVAEVWFDMSSPTPVQSTKFAALVRELQPDAVVNGRIWNNRGDFRVLGDNEIPATRTDGPWQTPASIYHSTWGYRSWQVREDQPGKIRDLAVGLLSVRARGGQYLLNIGPRGDGSVVEFESGVLRGIGAWLDRHPRAVLDTDPTRFGGQPWGEVTVCDTSLYLHVTRWPRNRRLRLPGLATGVDAVVVDGDETPLRWWWRDHDLVVELPSHPTDEVVPVVRVELDDELRLIPVTTVEADGDGVYRLPGTAWQTGHGYADHGSYSSQRRTTVRHSAFVQIRRGGPHALDLTGSVVDPRALYHLQIDRHSRIASGSALIGQRIGGLILRPGHTAEVRITLARPAHTGQDTGLRIAHAELRRE